MKGRIGIFGGTFNPVHAGHIAIGRCAAEEAGLDEVIFLPNGNPPHKSSDEYVDGRHRFNMLRLATAGERGFSVSDYELDGERHYTFETMEYFKSLYPDAEVMFIIGADSLDYLHLWHRGEELIKSNTFIVVNRRFREGYSFRENILRIEKMGGKIIVADMPFADVSSSQIRSDIAMGADNPAVNGDVYDYIRLNKLYCKE